jgi:hypothetical protein
MNMHSKVRLAAVALASAMLVTAPAAHAASDHQSDSCTATVHVTGHYFTGSREYTMTETFPRLSVSSAASRAHQALMKEGEVTSDESGGVKVLHQKVSLTSYNITLEPEGKGVKMSGTLSGVAGGGIETFMCKPFLALEGN